MKRALEKIEVKENPRYIPDEIVFNILTNVPVKSLLRFRCVSKQWLSIISDRQFVQSHLAKANENDNFTLRRHIIISTKPSPPSVKSVGFQSLDCENLSLSFGDRDSNTGELLCSCNGLLLVGTGEKDYFLWNPSTRSYKQIPSEFYHYKAGIRLYGLGYDSLANVYKVIRITRVTSCGPLTHEDPYYHYDYDATQVRFYNCKTGCWKRIYDFPYKLFVNGQGVLVNGAPHWIVARDQIREYVIIYFDSVEERFKEVETPSWLWMGTEFNFNLGVLGGLLCLVESHKPAKVWVMKGHGVWTKLFNITIRNSVPLCVRKNEEEVIFEIGKHVLVIYNLKDNMNQRILEFGGPTCDIVFNTVACVESLVSVSPDGW